MLLSGDNELSNETIEFLKDTSNYQSQNPGDTVHSQARESGTSRHLETGSASGNSILRRSFRVTTGRPGEFQPTATLLGVPDLGGPGAGLRKGSYGDTLSEKQKEAMVIRSKSVSLFDIYLCFVLICKGCRM